MYSNNIFFIIREDKLMNIAKFIVDKFGGQTAAGNFAWQGSKYGQLLG